MAKLHLPPAAVAVQPVMDPLWPLQPANVALAAGVAVKLPSSLFPTLAPQLFSQVVLFLASVLSVTATEPPPLPASVISMFLAAMTYGPTTGPPSPSGAAPAGSIELVEASLIARARFSRPLPASWPPLRASVSAPRRPTITPLPASGELAFISAAAPATSAAAAEVRLI